MEEMKRALFGILVIVLLASMVVGCGSGQEKIDLRYRLEQGKNYNVRVTSDMKLSRILLGRPVDSSMTIGFGYSCYVREVDASGVASLDVTYEWIYLKMELPDIVGESPTTIEYDSDRPSDTMLPETQAFSAPLGKSFSMDLSPSGEILKTEGADRITEQMLEGMPPGLDTESLREKLEEQLGLSLVTYPDHSVAVGDSWTKQATFSSSGSLLTPEEAWTLKERKDGVATIEVRSKFDPSQRLGPVESEAMTVYFRVSGEQKATLEVDEATGWPIYGEIHQDFSGEIEAMDTSWPITLTCTVHIESN